MCSPPAWAPCRPPSSPACSRPAEEQKAPLGSVSQMAHIRLGKVEEGRSLLIKDFVPLASLDDIVFGGWDPISANAYEAAMTAGVLDDETLLPSASELEGIVAMDGRLRPELGQAARRQPGQAGRQQVRPGAWP